MHALVRTVFSRLHQLDSALEEQKLKEASDEAQDIDVKMNVQTGKASSDVAPQDIQQPPSEDNEIESEEPREAPKEAPAVEATPTPISPGRLPKVQCTY